MSAAPDASNDSLQSSSALFRQTMLEEQMENGADPEEINELLSRDYHKQVDLNNASREELESIPFLTPELAENLAYYIYRYGPVKSINELLLVDQMDETILDQIRSFVSITDTNEYRNAPERLKITGGKQDYRLTFFRMLNKKEGFKRNASQSERFAGDPSGLSLRYGYNYKNKLRYGFVLEKDPGEAWWNRGIDYTSFHLQLKDLGRLRTLIAGDFRVQLAQGLVCGKSFNLGKSTTGGSPEQSGPALVRHYSASEYSFYRGLAATLDLTPKRKSRMYRMEITAFCSFRHPDADTLNGSYEAQTTTGLHRTLNERAVKSSLSQQTTGLQWFYKYPAGLISIQGLHWNTMLRDQKTVKELPAMGNGRNLSIAAKLRVLQLRLYGEYALDKAFHGAGLVGCQLKAEEHSTLQLLARSYSSDYSAAFANALSEGGRVKNEKGIFASIESQLFRKLNYVIAYDIYRFPQAGFFTKTASEGQEKSLFINGVTGKYGAWSFRYRTEIKGKNANTDNNPLYVLAKERKTQWRIQFLENRKYWQFRTLVDVNKYCFEKFIHFGYAVSTALTLGNQSKKWSLCLHNTLFNAKNWENRFYLWEKALPGSFSMPMLYGQGYRNGIYVQYSFSQAVFRLTLNKQTQPMQTETGSNGDKIQGDSRSELKIQISYRLNSTRTDKK